jgi:hypothetical protein
VDGVCHAVDYGLHLGGYRSEIIGGTHDQAVSVHHLLVKGLEVVILHAAPFFVTDPTGIAEFYLQLAYIHQFRPGALRLCLHAGHLFRRACIEAFDDGKGERRTAPKSIPGSEMSDG